MNYLETKKLLLKKLEDSYVLKNPTNIYEIKEQKLDLTIDNLNRAINKVIEDNKIRLFKSSNSYILNNPDMLYKFKSQALTNLISKLEVLNPLNTIKRGYAIVRVESKVISSINDLNLQDKLTLNLKDGNIKAQVIEKEG